MATYSFLLNDLANAPDDVGHRYLHVRSSRQRYSVVTVVAMTSLALAASVVVAGLGAFNFSEPQALSRTYGEQTCAPGHSMYRQPINNYASCCSHYGTTCCDLHGDSCKHKFEFVDRAGFGVSRPVTNSSSDSHSGRSGAADLSEAIGVGDTGRSTSVQPIREPSAKCEEMLSLLSCARCSPFAGHYVNSPKWLEHKPNMTVCESFCRELWTACLGSHAKKHGASPSGALQPTAGVHSPHWLYCTQQLGVHVGGAVLSSQGYGAGVSTATCFNAGSAAAVPARWLSLGGPALASLALLVLPVSATQRHRQRGGQRQRRPWCDGLDGGSGWS